MVGDGNIVYAATRACGRSAGHCTVDSWGWKGGKLIVFREKDREENVVSMASV